MSDVAPAGAPAGSSPLDTTAARVVDTQQVVAPSADAQQSSRPHEPREDDEPIQSISARFRACLFYNDHLNHTELSMLGPIVNVYKAETFLQHSHDACGYYAFYNAINAMHVARAAPNEVAFRANFLLNRGRFIDWFIAARALLGRSCLARWNYASERAYESADEILEPPEAQVLLKWDTPSIAKVADDVSVFQHFAVDALDTTQIRRLHKVTTELRSGARAAHAIMFGAAGHWMTICVFAVPKPSSPSPSGEATPSTPSGRPASLSNRSPSNSRRFEVVLFDSDARKTLNPDMSRVRDRHRDVFAQRAAAVRTAVKLVARCLRRAGGAAATIIDQQCSDLLKWLCKKAYDPPLVDVIREVTETPGAREWADQSADSAAMAKSTKSVSASSRTTKVVRIIEGGVLSLAAGTVKCIVGANYGYDNDNSDVTMLLTVFLTPQGGIHNLSVTNSDMGTRGNTGPGQGSLKRRLRLEYEPRTPDLPPAPKVTRNLEMLGEAQNLKLFTRTISAILQDEGFDTFSPGSPPSTISSTYLTAERRQQLQRVLEPVIRAAKNYDEKDVLRRMRDSISKPTPSSGPGFFFRNTRKVQDPVPLTRDLEGKLYVQRLFDDATAVLALAGVDCADLADEPDFPPPQPPDRVHLNGIIDAVAAKTGMHRDHVPISVPELAQVVRAFPLLASKSSAADDSPKAEQSDTASPTSGVAVAASVPDVQAAASATERSSPQRAAPLVGSGHNPFTAVAGGRTTRPKAAFVFQKPTILPSSRIPQFRMPASSSRSSSHRDAGDASVVYAIATAVQSRPMCSSHGPLKRGKRQDSACSVCGRGRLQSGNMNSLVGEIETAYICPHDQGSGGHVFRCCRGCYDKGPGCSLLQQVASVLSNIEKNREKAKREQEAQSPPAHPAETITRNGQSTNEHEVPENAASTSRSHDHPEAAQDIEASPVPNAPPHATNVFVEATENGTQNSNGAAHELPAYSGSNDDAGPLRKEIDGEAQSSSAPPIEILIATNGSHAAKLIVDDGDGDGKAPALAIDSDAKERGSAAVAENTDAAQE